jgi:hypothetical protein
MHVPMTGDAANAMERVGAYPCLQGGVCGPRAICYVGVVYDRVDDPNGPSSQYGIQWLPWEEFWRTHELKEFCGRLH